MEYARKIGYIALGGIIAVAGMFAAWLFTPSIIAPTDDIEVLDRIVCKELAIVDDTGKIGVSMTKNKNGGIVTCLNDTGKDVATVAGLRAGGEFRIKDYNGNRSSLSLAK